jgi:hypothetical protein
MSHPGSVANGLRDDLRTSAKAHRPRLAPSQAASVVFRPRGMRTRRRAADEFARMARNLNLPACNLPRCSNGSPGRHSVARHRPERLCARRNRPGRRNAKAARRLLTRLLKKQGVAPKCMITDKLRSYGAAKRQVMPPVEHRSHKGLNNRAENSHVPLPFATFSSRPAYNALFSVSAVTACRPWRNGRP